MKNIQHSALAILTAFVAQATAQNPPQAQWRATDTSQQRADIVNFTCIKDKTCIVRTHDHWWIGTRGGLARLNGQSLALERVYTPAEGLAGTIVSSLAVDGDLLWIGTSGGISRLDRQRFITHGCREPEL